MSDCVFGYIYDMYSANSMGGISVAVTTTDNCVHVINTASMREDWTARSLCVTARRESVPRRRELKQDLETAAVTGTFFVFVLFFLFAFCGLENQSDYGWSLSAYAFLLLTCLLRCVHLTNRLRRATGCSRRGRAPVPGRQQIRPLQTAGPHAAFHPV